MLSRVARVKALCLRTFLKMANVTGLLVLGRLLHIAENPPFPVDEYHRIADLGYNAGLADSKNGSVTPNPFDADQEPEQHDIWAATYLDGSGNSF